MHEPDQYAYLNERDECASPTGSIMETSYASSSDEGGSPWSGLTLIAKQVAQTINQSAKSLMNEFAELEYEARARSGSYDSTQDSSEHLNNKAHSTNNVTILPLPWEICFQSTNETLQISIVQKEDEILKEKILALSMDESVFTGPFNEKNSNEDDSMFTLDGSRVMLIRRLLEIDGNLGGIHAKVSGRSSMKEKIFWMNYFFHCEKLREDREREINDQSLRKALHDDELDAELVGRPPASCTGFYPRTGKLSLLPSASDGEDRIVPSLPNMECTEGTEGFVLVDGVDGL